MKNFWAYVVGFLLIIAAIFGAYYIGTQNVDKASNNNYYNNVIDNTDKVVSITPSDDEQYENAVNFNLKPVSTKYGIGDISGSGNGIVNYSGVLDGMWFTEYSASSFLTVERYNSENSNQSQYVYLKLSTKLGCFADNVLSKSYDGSVVFGFELTTVGELKLVYTYAAYGDRGVESTVLDMGNGSQFNMLVSMHVPYMLADDLSSVSALLSDEGYVKDTLTWYIVTGDGEKIFFKDSVISSISTIMKGLLNQYNGKPSYVDMTRFDWTNFLVVETDVEYDNILSDMTYRNGCASGDYSSFLGVKGFWSMFNNEESIYNVPLVSIVCQVVLMNKFLKLVFVSLLFVGSICGVVFGVKYNQKCKEIDNLYTQEEMDEKYQEYVNSIDNFQVQIDDLNGQVTILIAEKQQQEDTISSMQKSILEKDSQIESLTGEKQDFQNQIETLNAQIFAKDEQISSLITENGENEEEISQLQSDKLALESQVVELTIKVSDNDQQIEILTNDKKNLQAQVDLLISEKTSLQSQIETLNSQISSLETQIQRLNDLLAGYEEIKNETFTVDFYVDDDLYTTKVVKYGQYVSDLENPEETNFYKFNYWTLDGNTLIDPLTTSIKEDTVFYANITKKYQVDYVYNSDILKTEYVLAGSSINLFTPEEILGYTFNGWMLNDTLYHANDSFMVNSAVVFVADYSPSHYWETLLENVEITNKSGFTVLATGKDAIVSCEITCEGLHVGDSFKITISNLSTGIKLSSWKYWNADCPIILENNSKISFKIGIYDGDYESSLYFECLKDNILTVYFTSEAAAFFGESSSSSVSANMIIESIEVYR